MTSQVDVQQVEKAVGALMKYVAIKQNKKNKDQLIETEEYYNVIFALKKIPVKNHVKPIKITLPNSLYSGHGKEICLFTKDPQREYKDLVKSMNIKEITKVIGVTKLSKKYKPFETKRALCNAYDFFLADDRIIPMLPRLLGKKFFEKKKQPIAVRLSKSPENLPAEIRKALNSTTLHLGAGACTSVRFASTGHTAKEIRDNMIAAIESAIKHIPAQWKNIQSIHVKSTTSIALPIFNGTSAIENESPVVEGENGIKPNTPKSKTTPKKMASPSPSKKVASPAAAAPLKKIAPSTPQQSTKVKKIPAKKVLKIVKSPEIATKKTAMKATAKKTKK